MLSSHIASRLRSSSWSSFVRTSTVAGCAVLGLVLAMPGSAMAANLPVLRGGAIDPPVKTADFASLLVIDVTTGKTLYAMNPLKPWTAASLTKLMTSHLFMSAPRNMNATASIVASDEVGGGRLVVPINSKMTMRDLLYSAIVGSANNAAMALGRIGGGGNRTNFLKSMNRETSVLGLTATSYFDAAGMNPKNMTTAVDVALMLQEASSDPEIRKAMQSTTYQFTVATPSSHLNKTIKNTNTLLFGEPDVLVTAGKTGYLEESRYNFAFKAKPAGDAKAASKEVAVVVLGSATRAGSTDAAGALARWAWTAYDWTATTTPRFTRNMNQGDKGADVKALQQFLNTHGAVVAATGAGSKGKETELFGALTSAALARYQNAHAKEVLTPVGRTVGSGVLDFETRAALNGVTP